MLVCVARRICITSLGLKGLSCWSSFLTSTNSLLSKNTTLLKKSGASHGIIQNTNIHYLLMEIMKFSVPPFHKPWILLDKNFNIINLIRTKPQHLNLKKPQKVFSNVIIFCAAYNSGKTTGFCTLNMTTTKSNLYWGEMQSTFNMFGSL